MVFKSEVENQLRATLQQHRDALKQVEARLGKGGGDTEKKHEDVMHGIVAALKAKHEEELEELKDEIEQMKMNHAMEMGFAEG